MADRCPICGAAPRTDAPHPFCSPRCKKVDLGRWLDGAYRITTPLEPLPGPAGASPDDLADVPDPGEPTLH